jgi:alpha-L-fucosidase
MKKSFAYLFVALFVTMLFSTQKATAQYTIPAKMNWWYESRFGMFIHFGSYSYLAQGEWALANNGYTKATYQTQVSAKFNPAKFNAGTIARLAKRAGMKYLVITSKHHEGFCMWPTAVKSFKSIDSTKLYDLREYTAFDKTRDIIKELKDSCDAVGVKFCLYYSILDWNHPSQTISRGNSTNNWYTYSTMNSATAKASYIADMKAQLKELINNYHPAVLWFDGDWTYNFGTYTYGVTAQADKWWTKADGVDLQNYLRGLDPNLLMNERVFRSAGLGDWDCSEGSVLATANSRPWETCQTMNNSWGYNSGDNSYKTTKALILELVQNVSRDGNYLLNIGPKGDGTVPSQQITKLDSVGQWMDIYSSSIYGATRSPFPTEPTWGLFTKKSGKLYTQVFVWPKNGLLKVPSLTNTINKIYLLNDTTTLLDYKDSLGYIRISVPANAPNTIGSVVVIDVTGLPTASTKYTKVTGITVSGKGGLTTVLGVGGTLQMLTTITPSTATDKTITWSVNDTTIATISNTGLLTSKKLGSITVTATAKDGSDNFGQVKITVSAVSAISDPTTSSLKVFPNPASNGTVNLQYDNSSNMTNYSLVDILGRETLKGSFVNKTTIDLSGCKQGTYFIKVENEGKSEVQKLLVK